MNRMPIQLPRWLVSVEMAVCLVPLNLLFFAIVSSAVRGIMPLPDVLRFGSVALLGPLGLLLAVRVLFFARRSVARGTLIAMALLAGWTLFAYLAQTLHNGAVPFAWREYVLIALLPAVAIGHLAYLNSQGSSSRSPEQA